MYRLILFGGLSIATDGGPLTGRAVQRRRLALLALLATVRPRGMSRDKAIAYLWPASDSETGRHYLSDSVYRINQALGGDVIVAAGDDLRLDSQRLPTDLGEFEDAVAAGDPARAVSLYAGPFLDGFFLGDAPELERWIDAERARLAAAFARALEALAETAARTGDRAAAARWWRRLATHDPYNSRIALRLMEALRDAGERAAAIQHARIHEAMLKGELEIDVDPAITALADRLRVEPIPASVPRPPSPPPATPAPTAADGAAVPVATVESPTPSSSRRRRPGTPVARALVASTVVVALIAIWLLDGALANRTAVAPGGVMRSVAVLPFANVGGEPGNEYFSDGMTEELITTLGTVEGIAVASRTSAFAYKGRAVDVRQIASELGVDAVVEGSIRKSGRTLRVTAQLVSAKDGYRIWSEAYDRQVDDAFAVQEEIARAIVSQMRGTLIGAPEPVTAAGATRDAEAYDLYLRGRFAWHQRTREGLARAIEFFHRAVERAPTYARAHAGLGDAYAVSAFYDYLPPREAYPRAEASARRALAIDPRLAAPHATLGYVLTYYHLDWPAAEAEFQRALAIDRNYSTAHQWYANLLTVAGRFDEAEREMRLAQETDPLSLIANAALGWTLYYAGDHEGALEQCRGTLALEPNYVLAHLWGGWALAALGRRAEAREWIGRAIERSPENDLTRLSLAHLLAGSPSAAERDSSRAIVTAIEARGSTGAYVPSYEIAKVHLALGDAPRAFDWLNRAVDERSHSRAFLRVDPQLAPLRGDPRFDRLVVAAFREGANGR